jgi:hypothetical protein
MEASMDQSQPAGENNRTSTGMNQAETPLVAELDTEQPAKHDKVQSTNGANGNNPFFDLKASHCINALLTVAILSVAVTQCTVYQNQTGVMRSQQQTMAEQVQEMQAEQRAWISLASDSTIAGMEIDSQGGVRINLNIVLKNTGKDPAIRSYVIADTSVGKSLPFNSWKMWQTAVCQQPSNEVEVNVFPGDQARVEGVVAYISPEKMAEARRLFPPGKEFFTPSVILCLVYQDPITTHWHHTSYVFRIYMKSRKAVLVSDLPISGSDLAMLLRPIDTLPAD